MTRTIGEGIRVVDEVNRYGRMFRLNTWFRFKDTFYGLGTEVKPLKKVVQSGVLGWPLTVTVSGITGYDWKFYWSGQTDLDAAAGAARARLRHVARPRAATSPTTPRACTRTSAATGTTTAAASATWASTTSTRCSTCSARTTPARSAWTWTPRSSTTTPPARGAASNSPTPTAARSSSTARTATPTRPTSPGPNGKIFRGFRSDVPRLQELIATLPDPEPQIATFSDSVRTRRKFALNETNAHRSATLVNLGVIAVRLGRTLHYDPVRAALHERRGGQPADRSADARALGAVSDVTRTRR